MRAGEGILKFNHNNARGQMANGPCQKQDRNRIYSF
jgi:hypothetical protein